MARNTQPQMWSDRSGSDKSATYIGTRAQVRYLGPLPVGSWYILLNCVIYGFTSRMDRLAVRLPPHSTLALSFPLSPGVLSGLPRKSSH
eukprot:2724629-Rhodomonas_salina.1